MHLPPNCYPTTPNILHSSARPTESYPHSRLYAVCLPKCHYTTHSRVAFAGVPCAPYRVAKANVISTPSHLASCQLLCTCSFMPLHLVYKLTYPSCPFRLRCKILSPIRTAAQVHIRTGNISVPSNTVHSIPPRWDAFVLISNVPSRPSQLSPTSNINTQ